MLQQEQQMNVLSGKDESKNKTTHLERTIHLERQKVTISSRIIGIEQETPTVKTFKFSPTSSSQQFSFLPGQWLDVFLLNVPIVGGFSLTSTPQTFTKTKTFELAIKYSGHPPAKWLHEQANIGDEINARVGGEFVWNSSKEKQDQTGHVIFIAGGVGINPLISMLESICQDILSVEENNQNEKIEKIILLYSVRTFSELLFYKRIEGLQQQFPGLLECKYFLTRDAPQDQRSDSEFYYQQRINEEILAKVVEKEKEHLERLKCFVCGPSEMEDDVIKWLKESGVEEKRVLFEKWW
ncbi:10966_t:CDS:2 [Funneliformis geosporum]|uniref:Oxidoreductase NAD-binding domain-containing protein 1 n=1 Tax=Funneliformis geosporum TaxID=1117311 RepID=A0A9W4WQ58_9GLOM|nr:10966_t:CDS:2 [Funneliformis geosporum]CAI2177986.1 11445_t:CDS:2 [Funneliformis geosporum]